MRTCSCTKSSVLRALVEDAGLVTSEAAVGGVDGDGHGALGGHQLLQLVLRAAVVPLGVGDLGPGAPLGQ